MYVRAIDDRLPQLLNVPGCNRLWVGQFGGKHLDTRSREGNSDFTKKATRTPNQVKRLKDGFPQDRRIL